MNNPLLVEITRLCDLIQQKENQSSTPSDYDGRDEVLLTTQTNIDSLKERLHLLAEMLLTDAL